MRAAFQAEADAAQALADSLWPEYMAAEERLNAHPIKITVGLLRTRWCDATAKANALRSVLGDGRIE